MHANHIQKIMLQHFLKKNYATTISDLVERLLQTTSISG
jgi:hypothetical protein